MPLVQLSQHFTSKFLYRNSIYIHFFIFFGQSGTKWHEVVGFAICFSIFVGVHNECID
jgi:hypothetical protein